MAGIEEILINDQYLLVMGITLVFTIFALVRRTAVLDAIAMICWWIAGAVHLVSSVSSSPLFAVSFLWFGFGTIFLLLLFVDVWKFYNMKKANADWMDEEI